MAPPAVVYVFAEDRKGEHATDLFAGFSGILQVDGYADRRFRFHHGIDPVGLFRAVLANALHRGISQGGSTITQQLAKNLFLPHDRKWKGSTPINCTIKFTRRLIGNTGKPRVMR
jgi:hypothetical protein